MHKKNAEKLRRTVGKQYVEPAKYTTNHSIVVGNRPKNLTGSKKIQHVVSFFFPPWNGCRKKGGTRAKMIAAQPGPWEMVAILWMEK